MLDWFSGLIGYNSTVLRLGLILELYPDGEEKWRREKPIETRGSFASQLLLGRKSPTDDMLIASKKYDLICNSLNVLWLSGNPSKFIQGHNAFGPSVSSLAPVLMQVVKGLPEKNRPLDVNDTRFPAIHRNRVDITLMINMGSHKIVHEWLNTAAMSTRSRHGRPQVSGTTVYWGKHSTRWTMKAYCKLCEIREHRTEFEPVEAYNPVSEYVENQLRLELTLRTPELKEKGTLNESLIWDYMNRIEVGIMKKDIVKPNLKPAVMWCLTAWLRGEDVRMSFPRKTYYRYRSIIKDEVGVDISLPCTGQEKIIERKQFDLDYLKANEVKNVPNHLQGYLFKPGDSPIWQAH
jgi:hypothetical protein